MATPTSQARQVRRFADLDSLSRAAADELTQIAHAAVAARGSCHIALSGGSTPKRLFGLLAQRGAQALPWDHIELWWGDERTVPPDHADSNYRMTRESLLEPLGIAAVHVHRIAAETDPAAAALAYERELVAALGAPRSSTSSCSAWGPTATPRRCSPTAPALDETTRWVVANLVTSPLVHGTATRIT